MHVDAQHTAIDHTKQKLAINITDHIYENRDILRGIHQNQSVSLQHNSAAIAEA